MISGASFMKLHFNLHASVRIVFVDDQVNFSTVTHYRPSAIDKDAEPTSQRVRDTAEVTGYIAGRPYFIGSLANLESLSKQNLMAYDYFVVKIS